jgi:2-polyprenyl-3-methyl-5-hydroxy-6-metoxy-1,4-benzoquinol methylase
MKPASLERIYPAEAYQDIANSDTIRLHLERYHFAGAHLLAGNIADIACGSGYGSYLLATSYMDKVDKITAVEIDAAAIAYARSQYAHPNIEFIQEDVFSFNPSNLFNTIISLETIEHLSNPVKFIRHCRSMLINGGRFIVSAPVVPTTDANPFHLHDFSSTSFRKLFHKEGFTEICSKMQWQRYSPFSVSKKKKGRSSEIRTGLFRYYLQHPQTFLNRIRSLLTDGFRIKYLVVVFEKR